MSASSPIVLDTPSPEYTPRSLLQLLEVDDNDCDANCANADTNVRVVSKETLVTLVSIPDSVQLPLLSALTAADLQFKRFYDIQAQAASDRELYERVLGETKAELYSVQEKNESINAAYTKVLAELQLAHRTISNNSDDYVKQEARVDLLRRDIRDYSRRLENSKKAFRAVVAERNGYHNNLRTLKQRLNQRSDGTHAGIQLEKAQVESKLADTLLHVHFLEAEIAAAHHCQEGFEREISSLSTRLEQHAMERSELARAVLILTRTDLLPFHLSLDKDIDFLQAHIRTLTPESYDSKHLLDYIRDILDGFSSVVTAGFDGCRAIETSLICLPPARDYASLFSSKTGPSAFDLAIQAGTMVRPDFDTLVYPPSVPSPLPFVAVDNWDGLNAMLHEPIPRPSSAPPELPVTLLDHSDGDSLYASSSNNSVSGNSND
ncbi:hypothetical protein BT96DRAFT_926477 [Gymnopus androsaceus JB14]|uniref:Uncharacterized protein n=1 Tax=Gymnopus androsaceus JB14 TaxID=1447944 RepID=A0A6A4GWV0_9AGAR|nr:hypothetical protein BT96DRAFT_926477 [Gymnopus androsaceus JB14]